MPQRVLPRFDLKGWADEDIANPYPVYQRYRDVAPVHHSPSTSGEPDTYYVFCYDDVASVLSSQHFGRNASVASTSASPAPVLIPAGHQVLRRIVENWLVFLDPPRHTKLRSLLNKEFSPTVVTGLRARIAEIARELLAEMKQKPVFDLVEDFAAPLPILVISELLGVAKAHRAWFRERAVSLQEASTSRAGRGGGGYARADAAARELADYFWQEVQRRRGGDHDDLVTLLVRAQDRGESLSADEIVATCVHLLTAGHETTTNFLSKSMLALLANPEVLDDLRATPALTPDAVEELMRYDSPVQAVTRWAYRDEQLGEHEVRRGSKIVLLLGSANRDPMRFPHPDVLDIHRPINRHVGFGMGIHYCLGATLARTEAEIGLKTLLEGIPEFSLGTQRVDYADDMVFHGPMHLVLRTGSFT